MEPERCPSFINALKNGAPIFTPTTASIADGLTVPTVGCNAVATAGLFRHDAARTLNRAVQCHAVPRQHSFKTSKQLNFRPLDRQNGHCI